MQLISKTLAVALMLAFSTLAAHAQATRTWVSGVGDDANPCSRTAPCKTFAGAYSKTATAGEINAIDPGGFGSLTITHSITIRANPVEAGILVASGDGITINAGPTDNVVLQGLDFEGSNLGNNGITIAGGGNVTIDHCDIRDFLGNGVNLVGMTNTRAVITASRILNSGGGINVQGAGGAINVAFVYDSVIDNNANFDVQAGTGATIAIRNDLLTGSNVAISTLNNGNVLSFGGNVLRGSGTPTSNAATQ